MPIQCLDYVRTLCSNVSGDNVHCTVSSNNNLLDFFVIPQIRKVSVSVIFLCRNVFALSQIIQDVKSLSAWLVTLGKLYCCVITTGKMLWSEWLYRLAEDTFH